MDLSAPQVAPVWCPPEGADRDLIGACIPCSSLVCPPRAIRRALPPYMFQQRKAARSVWQVRH